MTDILEQLKIERDYYVDDNEKYERLTVIINAWEKDRNELLKLKELEREVDDWIVISHMGTIDTFKGDYKTLINTMACYELGVGQYFTASDCIEIAETNGNPDCEHCKSIPKLIRKDYNIGDNDD